MNVKLFVTLGTTNGFVEKEFEIPGDEEFITYMGLEVESADEEKINQRETIVRIPFFMHEDHKGLHTICRRIGDDIDQIEF